MVILGDRVFLMSEVPLYTVSGRVGSNNGFYLQELFAPQKEPISLGPP